MTNPTDDETGEMLETVISKLTREEVEMLLKVPKEIIHEVLGEMRRDTPGPIPQTEDARSN